MTNILNKPLIGLTIDSGYDDSYSPYPWYALRKHYAEYIANAGGVPILLPYCLDQAAYYAELIDGLLITGGDFDISPHYWGEAITSGEVILNNPRTEFEMAITKLLLLKDKPILGICNGQQLLNVLFGGSIIQHIPDTVPSALNHKPGGAQRHKPSHTVAIAANTLLAEIMGQKEISVNSNHHQAVAKVADELIVNARASDGIIEGIEHPHKRFVLGVQWHPEYDFTEADKLLVKKFIAACSADL